MQSSYSSFRHAFHVAAPRLTDWKATLLAVLLVIRVPIAPFANQMGQNAKPACVFKIFDIVM